MHVMHNIINNLFINSGILYFHDIYIFYNQDLRISQTSIDLKKCRYKILCISARYGNPVANSYQKDRKSGKHSLEDFVIKMKCIWNSFDFRT